MVRIIVTNRGGVERPVEADADLSLMEAIRANGFDQLVALCGGNCACGTCHVYVDADSTSALPALSDDENDLLDTSECRNERSRLACQIPLGAEMDGLRVAIAPED